MILVIKQIKHSVARLSGEEIHTLPFIFCVKLFNYFQEVDQVCSELKFNLLELLLLFEVQILSSIDKTLG